jgi:hypothetical protein
MAKILDSDGEVMGMWDWGMIRQAKNGLRQQQRQSLDRLFGRGENDTTNKV